MLTSEQVVLEPLRVSILTQGPFLVASVHTALDDEQLLRFRRDLIDLVGTQRSRGVIIDVAALDVLDSFGAHTLQELADVTRLRGAETVVVGIRPDVAIAMVRLGIDLGRIRTALDLDEGLSLLPSVTGHRS